jgi:fucose 4-O-acetylase-like acetyltransferase
LALAFAYLIFASKAGPKPAFFIASLAYVLSVLAGGYAHTEAGISIPFTSRNGPFVSAFFVMLGWYFSTGKIRLNSWFCLLLAASGLSIQYLEYTILTSHYMRAEHYEFLFGTPFFAAGVFLLALNTPSRSNLISFFGKASLGIYVLHILIIDNSVNLIKILDLKINYIDLVFITTLVYLISFAISRLLLLNPKLRYVIS